MTTRMSLADADERFGLGVRRGFVPTAEPVSDTDSTPFGLTLRTAPAPRNVVVLRTGSGATMATESVTEQSTDGQDEGDTRFDVANDI
ncbi:hypothetical protein G3I59_32735 [Amycolatopsis rubida]|uniref:Uncharacterized protein n=1 Tax=Amycolatopsis rubida TaxID=112413 RepID=A0A1I5WCA5_9PSEU|nr:MULTISPECIES: hypothetical protein [Amycolatopsis]MYW95239.1 hypothetical protein [Amycolatopsis rubida]NEC60227.1 hypothetical protein [Amycolatopsis rubida]OAP28363.1 hypothetical protein A4R44_00150 [Amycolatopsis sp. M39]SFQ17373.1 hypothetical protein SAMN05421854_109159 [Amycolatopsis rubida]